MSGYTLNSGVKLNIGDVVTYKRKVPGDCYIRNKSSYSTKREVVCEGVVKLGWFDDIYCLYVESENENTYKHYFFGTRECDARYSTKNLSECISLDKDYSIITKMHE